MAKGNGPHRFRVQAWSLELQISQFGFGGDNEPENLKGGIQCFSYEKPISFVLAMCYAVCGISGSTI